MWKRKITAIALVMTMFLCTGCLKGHIYKCSGNLVDDLYQNHYRRIIKDIVIEIPKNGAYGISEAPVFT